VKAYYNKRILKRLGKKIKSLREKESISQSQLAFECGISQVQVSRIETGEINTTVGTLSLISKVLGVSIKDLF
jgi:transcriptional regulator with XRE-family HTH domain